MTRPLALAALAALLSVSAAGQPPEAPSQVTPQRPAPHLEAPGNLPLAARNALALRMANHANDLEWLLAAALTLNHALAEQAATEIASTPRFGRPLPGDLQSLNALLPKRFFELQDQLAQRARAVAKAARTHDDRALAAAMGRMTSTCIECHSVYLHGTKEDPPNSEDDETPAPPQ
ncbi:MAG: cytochrome c [Myxococcales bacterium]